MASEGGEAADEGAGGRGCPCGRWSNCAVRCSRCEGSEKQRAGRDCAELSDSPVTGQVLVPRGEGAVFWKGGAEVWAAADGYSRARWRTFVSRSRRN